MCASCDSWRATARRAWDEVFRLTHIVQEARPYLPVEVQGPIEGLLGIIGSVDRVQLQQRIGSLAATCERVVSGSARTELVSSRRKILDDAALAAGVLGDVIRSSLQYLQITRDVDANLSAGLRYLAMMNSVMDNWIGSMCQQQQNWDMMWAQYKQQQTQIDRMRIDALTGTPFMKAYLV